MNFSKILKEVAVFSPVRILAPLIGIVSIYINTRVFSQEEYGVINLIISTTSLVNTLVFGWIGYVLVRYYHKYKQANNLSGFLSTIWTIVLISCAITTIILFAVSFLLIPSNHLLILIVTIQFPISIVNGYISNLLQMESDAKRYNIYGVVSTIINFALYLFLVLLTPLKLEAIFIPGLLLGLITLIIEGIRFRKLYVLKLSLFDSKIISEGLRYGLPQIGVSVSAILLSIGDRYLIQYYYGESAVGEYSAGYRIGEMLILLPTGIIASVVAPLIFKCYEEEGIENTKELVENLYLAYVIVLLPFVIIAAAKPEVFLILIGSKYVESLAVIPSVVIGSFIFGICQFTGIFLQILGKTTTIMVLIILATIANLLLNVILLKPLFIFGSALATLLAYIIYLALINKYSLNEVKLYFINKKLIRTVLSATPIMACVLLCNFLMVSNIVTISLSLLITVLYFLLELRKDSILRKFIADDLLIRFKSKIHA